MKVSLSKLFIISATLLKNGFSSKVLSNQIESTESQNKILESFSCEETCSLTSFSPSGNGKCSTPVCFDEYPTFSSGLCFVKDTSVFTIPCPTNYALDASADCVGSTGFSCSGAMPTYSGGKCYPSGLSAGSLTSVVCPGGFYLSGTVCMQTNGSPTCPAGTSTSSSGVCYNPYGSGTISCASGYYVSGYECVKFVKYCFLWLCPFGSTCNIFTNQCLAHASYSCPSSTVMVGSKCYPVVSKACPAGYTDNGAYQCIKSVAPICPTNYYLSGSSCIPNSSSPFCVIGVPDYSGYCINKVPNLGCPPTHTVFSMSYCYPKNIPAICPVYSFLSVDKCYIDSVCSAGCTKSFAGQCIPIVSSPTFPPSSRPYRIPTFMPSTSKPSLVPSRKSTFRPSANPTSPTTRPYSSSPTVRRTKTPSRPPARPSTKSPTSRPSSIPSKPSAKPSTSVPSTIPTYLPSVMPTGHPSSSPTTVVPFSRYAFQQKIVIPRVIDMRAGGTHHMQMAEGIHDWGIDPSFTARIYGYSELDGEPTFPGPTILTKVGVPINIIWHNKMAGSHILDAHVERSLLFNVSVCYPDCGVAGVVHVHGMESPAKYDGLPGYAINAGEQRFATYLNTQLPKVMTYHDHSPGLTRLNIWAGLVGAYILEDKELDSSLGLDFSGCDIPLLIADRLVDGETGELLYPESCLRNSNWASEAYGYVYTVNGIITPYLEVPQQMCSLRFLNVANSVLLNINLPFADRCKIIGNDGGYLKTPQSVNSKIVLAAYERVQLMCDFSHSNIGSSYDIRSDDREFENAGSAIMQIRITTPAAGPASASIPTQLLPIKNLKDIWDASTFKGEVNVSLYEVPDQEGCPTMLHMAKNNVDLDYINMGPEMLLCKKGYVEKWNFYNYSPDEHPFHWHAVNAQCGDDENSINSNGLKDVSRIPNAEDMPHVRTHVCYVACTPSDYLLEGTVTAADGFLFDTTEPYMAHCHILEHEENMMMSGFAIVP